MKKIIVLFSAIFFFLIASGNCFAWTEVDTPNKLTFYPLNLTVDVNTSSPLSGSDNNAYVYQNISATNGWEIRGKIDLNGGGSACDMWGGVGFSNTIEDFRDGVSNNTLALVHSYRFPSTRRITLFNTNSTGNPDVTLVGSISQNYPPDNPFYMTSYLFVDFWYKFRKTHWDKYYDNVTIELYNDANYTSKNSSLDTLWVRSDKTYNEMYIFSARIGGLGGCLISGWISIENYTLYINENLFPRPIDIPVATPTSCGYVTSNLVLTSNITMNMSTDWGTCFVMNTSGVTLDCDNNYVINNATQSPLFFGSEYANPYEIEQTSVIVPHASNVQIRDCNFRDFKDGIKIDRSSHVDVINVNSISNQTQTYWSTPSRGVDLYGIKMQDSNNVQIYSSNFTLLSANGTTGGTNQAGGDGGAIYGFFVQNTTENLFYNNRITAVGGAGGTGFSYVGVPFTAGQIGGQGGYVYGIFMNNSGDTTVERNSIISTAGKGGRGGDALCPQFSRGGHGGYSYGIYQTGGSYNVLMTNNITSTSGRGGDTGNDGLCNGITGNGGNCYGIYLSGVDNAFSANNISCLAKRAGDGSQNTHRLGLNGASYGIYSVGNNNINDYIESSVVEDGSSSNGEGGGTSQKAVGLYVENNAYYVKANVNYVWEGSSGYGAETGTCQGAYGIYSVNSIIQDSYIKYVKAYAGGGCASQTSKAYGIYTNRNIYNTQIDNVLAETSAFSTNVFGVRFNNTVGILYNVKITNVTSSDGFLLAKVYSENSTAYAINSNITSTNEFRGDNTYYKQWTTNIYVRNKFGNAVTDASVSVQNNYMNFFTPTSLGSYYSINLTEYTKINPNTLYQNETPHVFLAMKETNTRTFSNSTTVAITKITDVIIILDVPEMNCFYGQELAEFFGTTKEGGCAILSFGITTFVVGAVGAVTGGIGVIFAGVLMPIAFTLLGWIPLWLALIIVIILIYLGFELLKRGFE